MSGRGKKPSPAVKKSSKRGKSTSKSVRAGLTFPIARLDRIIRQRGGIRVGQGAPVYLAAVTEYLCGELLELAGNCARDNKKVRINDRCLMLVIKNDEELNKLFNENKALMGGGIIPNIHSVLLAEEFARIDKKEKKKGF